MKKPAVIVALDVARAEEALDLVERFGSHLEYVKVGMELFYSEGPKIVKSLRERGLQVFLDLKIHDIPHTAERSAASLTDLGVAMLTVHCAGGTDMMEAVLQGAAGRLTVVGVTQLTSIDQMRLNHELMIPGSMEECVSSYAGLAAAAGLAGVVCSPWESQTIKDQFGPDFLTVTPGIRWERGSDDQKRIMSPEAAAAAGSDFLVIGRPLTRAADPRQALSLVQQRLEVCCSEKQRLFAGV